MFHPYLRCSSYTKSNTKCRNKAQSNGFCNKHRNHSLFVTKQQTFSICFGDKVCYNNEMQMIGEEQRGFNLDELNTFKSFFLKKNIDAQIFDLSFNTNADAYILIAKKGLECFTSSIDLLYELDKLERDDKVYFRGRIVNSCIKHNLCFDDIDQEPDIENKKGRITSFTKTPVLNHVRESLNLFDKDLKAHVKYYYDIDKCNTSFQGSENKVHIGIRLGANMTLRFGWFYRHKQIGGNIDFDLEDGDIYILSEKATGYDYNNKYKLTLRHCEAVFKQ